MSEPTCTTDEFGNKEWRLNGKLHRIDGPAVELTDCYKSWWFNGKLHRIDGPAIEWFDIEEWYLNGKKVTKEEVNDRINGPFKLAFKNQILIYGRKNEN